MKVKQFYGVTYEEHHNLMFGDYVKISLHDWQLIQEVVKKHFIEERKVIKK